MADPLLKVKERLQARRNQSTPPKQETSPPTPPPEVGRCFNFLPVEICPMIKSRTFQITNMVPVFPKKPETSHKVICGILNDTARPHTVRGGDKKERAGKWVYLTFGTDAKPAHLGGEYGEIPNTNEIIFFRGYGTARDRESAAVTR